MTTRPRCPWCRSDAFHAQEVKRFYYCLRCGRGGSLDEDRWINRPVEPTVGDKAAVGDRVGTWEVEEFDPETGDGVLFAHSKITIAFSADKVNGGFVAYNNACITFNEPEQGAAENPAERQRVWDNELRLHATRCTVCTYSTECEEWQRLVHCYNTAAPLPLTEEPTPGPEESQ